MREGGKKYKPIKPRHTWFIKGKYINSVFYHDKKRKATIHC